MKETWKDKVKQDIFPIGIWHDSLSGYERRLEYMENFISKELESAKKVERERIVEALEGLKLETDIFYSKCTPIQVLDQVINLINK